MMLLLERVKCSATELTGVQVPETDFEGVVSLECSQGWIGTLNATCLTTGDWSITSPCGTSIHCFQ